MDISEGSPRTKRTESCLQVQVVGHRDVLEIVRRFEREIGVVSIEKRRTIIRYDRAATLKSDTGETDDVSVQYLMQERHREAPRNYASINGM
jgi:hypothetical protein